MTVKPPFFILSNPRSGSSLLRIMLECHEKITVPPECGFIEWWADKYNYWQIQDSENRDRVDEFCFDLASSKKFETWHFDIDILKNQIITNKPENYSELCAQVFIAFAKQKGKDVLIWGDKNNYYINKLSVLNSLYPDAKYIHLIRDGRDVATSYLEIEQLNTTSIYKPKLATSIEKIAKEWDNNLKNVNSFFNTLGLDNKIIIRYEDLITETHLTLQSICLFLGVDFDSNMLRYHEINKEKSIEPNELLDWKIKTLEKPDLNNIGKFNDILSPQQIKEFESKAFQSLMTYGYL